MNRLKNILVHIDPSSTAYTDLYEAPIIVYDPETGVTTEENDNTFWEGAVGFEITRTHKLALDKPTVLVLIPTDVIFRGSAVWHTVKEEHDLALRSKQYCAAADASLRMLIPYVACENDILYNRGRPDEENGKFYMQIPGGEVLMRNGAFIDMRYPCDYELSGGRSARLKPSAERKSKELFLCIMVQVQLPKGRIKKATQMLTKTLPNMVDRFVQEHDISKLDAALDLAKRQYAIRQWLKNSRYCVFLANGSILPRNTEGNGPMQDAYPFISPAEDEIEIEGTRGMGIPKGVTVITGGGYSGKTTLLSAISAGVYDHCPGDGREFVMTDNSAMEISTEEGRSVQDIDIGMFMRWLPQNADTAHFSTHAASGSTSQAANIIEAIGYGCTLLLIDEDRSATNIMIRDAVMRKLIENEPIIPFTDRIRHLSEIQGVSSVLVIGGSSEYLGVADRVYMMQDYRLTNVTEQAKNVAPKNLTNETPLAYIRRSRLITGLDAHPFGSGSERLGYSRIGIMSFGEEDINLRVLNNAVTEEQRNAIAFILRQIAIRYVGKPFIRDEVVQSVFDAIEHDGLDAVYSSYFTQCGRFIDLPRTAEVAATIDRMRSIVLCQNTE